MKEWTAKDVQTEELTEELNAFQKQGWTIYAVFPIGQFAVGKYDSTSAFATIIAHKD